MEAYWLNIERWDAQGLSIQDLLRFHLVFQCVLTYILYIFISDLHPNQDYGVTQRIDGGGGIIVMCHFAVSTLNTHTICQSLRIILKGLHFVFFVIVFVFGQ